MSSSRSTLRNDAEAVSLNEGRSIESRDRAFGVFEARYLAIGDIELGFNFLPRDERVVGIFRDGCLEIAKVFQVFGGLLVSGSSHGFGTSKSLKILFARKSMISR